MATATATLAAPPPPPALRGATVVTPAPEPVLVPPPAPITAAPAPPPRVVDASVEQVMTARARLWSDMDSTAALVEKVEGAAATTAGAPAAGVPAHTRLTAGLDLVAELEQALSRLSGVYEGTAAREFKAHWARMQSGLREYNDGARAIRALLDQRLSALKEADRPAPL